MNKPIGSETLNKWDERFLRLAFTIGQWSKDRSTKIGCVIADKHRIVRSTGYNGFTRGIDDSADEKHQKIQKYKWTEHAERNAIYNAARIGMPIDRCTLYVNWFPCGDCTRAIIQSGINRVVAITPDFNDQQWADEFHFSSALIKEVGLTMDLYDFDDINPRK